MNPTNPIPPNDITAEMSLLCSAMLNAACIDTLNREGFADGFYLPEHGVLWSVLAELRRGGKAIDSVIVRDRLTTAGYWEKFGGSAWLADILNAAPSVNHAEHYAAIVRDKAERRGILKAAEKAIAAVGDGDDPSEIVQSVAKDLLDAAAGGTDRLETIGDLATAALAAAGSGGVKIIPYAWAALRDGPVDDPGAALGGIAAGEMCVVGGRTSMGKSLFTRQQARYTAQQGIPTLLISLEEPRAKIGRNALATEGMIPNGMLRTGHLDERQWDNASRAADRLRDVPLYVTTKARKLGDIRAVIAGAMARHGVQFVAIDYLQRVRAPGENKYEQVSAASTGIADIAAELEVAIMAPAQINRGPTNRTDKEPTLADLRDSGKIEEDADTCLLLHRPSYYDSNDRPGEVDVIAGKVRDGQRGGTYTLGTRLDQQRFYDIDDDRREQFAREMFGDAA